MVCRKIKGLDKEVSPIVQGTHGLTNGDATDWEALARLFDDALSLGINCFDTAWRYDFGGSERALGYWTETRGNRDKVIILSKCAHPNELRFKNNPFDVYADITDSLIRLKTSYIDLYLFHRDDPNVPVGVMVETMNRLREQGKILEYGGSNWTARRLEEANEYAYKYGLHPMAVTSPSFGLAEQYHDAFGAGCITLTGTQMQDERDWYAKTGMPVFAYSSLGRGWFSGAFKHDEFEANRHKLDKFALGMFEGEGNLQRLARCEELAQAKGVKVPQVALSYVVNHPAMNVFALVGSRNRQEIEEAVKACEMNLTEAECRYLNLESDSLK